MPGQERKTAFILAGGASRGAYQAGCLKRLEEEGIEPDLVVGLLDRRLQLARVHDAAARRRCGRSGRARCRCRACSTSRCARTRCSATRSSRWTGWLRFVEKEVDFDACFDSDVELTYIVTNLSAGREELRGNRTESDVERFRTVTRIGYAIPILHPLIELDGDLYADGGFLWNVPFEYAEEWGADRHLHPLGGPVGAAARRLPALHPAGGAAHVRRLLAHVRQLVAASRSSSRTAATTAST